MNYEKAYKELKEIVINLKPYCNNCANAESENGCDECHRKSFYWKMDTYIINEIEKGCQ